MRNVPQQSDEIIHSKKLGPKSHDMAQQVENLTNKIKQGLHGRNHPPQVSGTPNTIRTHPYKEEVNLHMKFNIHKRYDFHKPRNCCKMVLQNGGPLTTETLLSRMKLLTTKTNPN